MRAEWRLAGAALALLLGGVGAARGETLADAVAFAYTTNPDLLSQRAQVRVLDEDYVQARAALGPTVEVSGGPRYDYNRLDTIFGTLSENEGGTAQGSIAIVQPLITFGRAAASVDRAYANVEAGRSGLRQGETDVLTSIVGAYVGVLHDQRAVGIAEENRALLERQLADTQARYDARDATATDLSQTQSRYSAALGDLAAARGRLDVSRTIYLSVVGRNPGELAPEPALAGLPTTLSEALAQAERNSPALQAALFREESARADRAAAFAKGLPQVSLRIDATDGPASAFANDRRETDLSARVVVSQTLFSSGANASLNRQTAARSQSARADADATRREIVQNVGQSWTQVMSLRAIAAHGAEQVAALRVALDGAREEERLGARTTLEVLNQAQELQAAQLELARTQADFYLAQVALLGDTGALNVAALAPGVGPYEPARDFDRVKARGDVPWTPALLFFDQVFQVHRGVDLPPDPALGVIPRLEQGPPDR